MKKILIACLVVFFLIGVAGIAAGYYFIYRPAKAYVASVAQLQEIPKLDAQVRNTAAFVPPTTGELTQDRVQRFLQTQQAVQTYLGNRINELEEKHKAIVRHTAGTPDRQPSISEALSLLKDMSALVVEAKRAQVQALNQQSFSLPEYEWTRSQVYAAAGIPVDAFFADAIRDAANGRVPDFERNPMVKLPPVPEKNRQLIEPHQRILMDRSPLVFFGL